MQQKSKRWFPKPGDLVAVPLAERFIPKNYTKSTYGIVVQETCSTDFVGVWWDVFFDGEIESLNIQIITPLWDIEGKCLRN